MKRLNKKGFTLIELLAVIVIMGVLMIVAIPAVSRTIENARRDSFADTAKEYINAVRNAVLADNISCKVNGNNVVASATPGNTTGQVYYYAFATGTKVAGSYNDRDLLTTTASDLMESGGKSPFGNAEIEGTVQWFKQVDTTTGKTTTTYSIALRDSSNHGWATPIEESAIARSKVGNAVTSPLSNPTGIDCFMN